MMITRSNAVAALLIPVGFLAAPVVPPEVELATAAVELCGNCEWDDNPNLHHWFEGVSAELGYSCEQGEGCHFWLLYNVCGAIHDVCFGGDEEEDEDALLDYIETAARKGDTPAVRQLMAKYPGKILLNTARASLQITSCDGRSIVANFPLAPGTTEALVD